MQLDVNRSDLTVGVIGAGAMGRGIAQVAAAGNMQVLITDSRPGAAQEARDFVDKLFARAAEKGSMTREAAAAATARIKVVSSLAEFKPCHLVVEAVVEDLEVKKKVFAQLDKVCPAHAVLATNTSVLSVTDIAVATKRPEKVLGIHFSNPVPLMKMLEIIKTLATSDETLTIARDFCTSIGKKVVVAKDAAGFLANRILCPFLLNAIRMMEAGYAAEDIDNICTMGMGHPMGPLTLLDLIGIDTVYRGAIEVYDELKDPQYNPPTLMRKMVTLGWHGRKTGKGFYTY